MLARAKLIKFLNHNIVEDHYGAECSAIRLCQTIGDAQITRWKIQKGIDIGNLATQISEWAEQSGAGKIGVTEFYLEAFFEGSEIGENRLPFIINNMVPGTVGHGEMGSFPVGEGQSGAPGLLTQAHRHTEFAVESLIAKSEREMERAEAREEKMSAKIEALERQIQQFWSERQDMLDREEERKLKRIKAEAWNQRIQEALDMIRPLIPIAINGLAGGPLVPQDTLPIFESLAPVMESLDPEKLGKLAEVIGMNNMPPLIELYKAFKQRKMLQEKKKDELAKVSPFRKADPAPPVSVGGNK